MLLLSSTSAFRVEAQGAPSATVRPATRAERSGYRETSQHADVVAFLDSLASLTAPLAFGSIGRTKEEREIPYVIASRPLVRTALEARASGKPVVYVQANIHGGEVEGKEALLALLRDLALARSANVLDSVVLVAVPIYNADGNEKWGPQHTQRGAQNGPAIVGQRANAQSLDLNRDYVKAEAPETRASLAMLDAWDPDVFVDLHTTNGSYHGYALTYAPSLAPGAPLGGYTRELLAELRARMRTRTALETFDYGNFTDVGGEVGTDTTHAGWATYDARPRFGTNYMGLRGKVSVLSEAYSHDPFERRVKSTYAFVAQLLSLVAERRTDLLARTRRAPALPAGQVAMTSLRSALPSSAPSLPVTYEILTRTRDSAVTEPGVPPGVRRTGKFRTRLMPVFDRFESVLAAPLPALYVFTTADTALRARLQRHGVIVDHGVEVRGRVEEFVVDSIAREARSFQGHNEVRLSGRWRELPARVLRDVFVVSTTQRLGALAAFLLEPMSEDGFATWNVFDGSLAVGQPYPVRRMPQPR